MLTKLQSPQELPLRFKGKRQYLQGGDIYDAVMSITKDLFGEKAWVDFIVFRSFARKSCEVIFAKDEKMAVDNAIARFTAKIEEHNLNGVVVETERAVEGRYEYDEDKIIQTASINKQCITQVERAGFTAIEEVIALTKSLHYDQIPIEQGQWVFTQLDLTSPFAAESLPFSIELKQNLAGKMTISEVKEDGVMIGKIRFTVAKP